MVLHHPLYVSTEKTKKNNRAAVRQCTSTYGRKGQREEYSSGDGTWYSQAHQWEAGILETKKNFVYSMKKDPMYGTAHPPTTEDAVHPPPTHRPNLYYMQQYSSAAVRTAVHLVRGEQLVGWFLKTLYETGNYGGNFIF